MRRLIRCLPILALFLCIGTSSATAAPQSILVGGGGDTNAISDALDYLGYSYQFAVNVYGMPPSLNQISGYDVVIWIVPSATISNLPDYSNWLNAGGRMLFINGYGSEFSSWLSPILKLSSTPTGHDSSDCTPDWTKSGTHPITQYMPATYEFADQNYTGHYFHIDGVQTGNVQSLGQHCHGSLNNSSLALREYPNDGAFVYMTYNLQPRHFRPDHPAMLRPFLQGFLGWPRNFAPAAIDDTAQPDEDTSVTIDVLANDTDPDSDPLTVDSVSTPANGVATIVSNQIDYAPAANFNGSDTFTYTMSDDSGESATATVTVTVNPINDPPTFVNPTPAGLATLTVVEGKLLSMNLAAEDIDQDLLTYGVDPLPDTASLDVATGEFSWTPGWEDIGSRQLTLTVSDAQDSDTREITVVVTMLDADGDGVSDGQEIDQGLDPTTNDTDADGVLDGDDACPLESGQGADGCPLEQSADAGSDVGRDAGSDVGRDAGSDVGREVGLDAGSDDGGDASTTTADRTGSSAKSGCGCRSTGGEPGGGSALLLFLGLAALRLRDLRSPSRG